MLHARILSDYYRFPINLVFAVYLLKNEILVLSRGEAFAPYFKAPSWGFCINARPQRGAFAAFPKQNDKCPGGGRARLELTEPLPFFCRNFDRFTSNFRLRVVRKLVTPCRNGVTA